MKSFLLWCALLFSVSGLLSPLCAHTCTISAAGVSFGTYDPTIKTDVTDNGSVSVNCTYAVVDYLTGFTATVSLSQGDSGTFTARTLKQGAQSLNYNLYLNAGATGMIFGDGTAGTVTYVICYPALLGSCSNQGSSGQNYSVPVYGRLPAGQDVSAGLYSDTLTATVTF